MKIPQMLYIAAAVLAALVIAKECGYREGKKIGKQQQIDVSTDLRIRMLQQAAWDSTVAYARQRDSISNVIAKLRSRIPRGVVPTEPTIQHQPTEAVGPVAPGASVSGCAGAPAQCDTLIAVYEAGRQQDSLQLLFWKAHVQARDSLIAVLQASRDTWKAQSKRRLACVGGPAVAVGLHGQGAIGVGVACGYRF